MCRWFDSALGHHQFNDFALSADSLLIGCYHLSRKARKNHCKCRRLPQIHFWNYSSHVIFDEHSGDLQRGQNAKRIGGNWPVADWFTATFPGKPANLIQVTIRLTWPELRLDPSHNSLYLAAVTISDSPVEAYRRGWSFRDGQ